MDRTNSVVTFLRVKDGIKYRWNPLVSDGFEFKTTPTLANDLGLTAH